MARFAIFIGVVVLVLSILAENAQAGRTIKKQSAVPKKALMEAEELEDSGAPAQDEKMMLSVKEVIISDSEGCSEEDDPKCNKKKPSGKSKNTGIVTTTSAATPIHPIYQQRPPVNMYDLHYRNRLRNTAPAQVSSSAQRLLPKLQRASMEMARGILSGLGWDVDGWEMVLLESIVRTVTKDLLLMFQMFF